VKKALRFEAINQQINVFFFFGSKEHFSIFFVQYLGVTAGIEPAT
jgi:hypothetical protein